MLGSSISAWNNFFLKYQIHFCTDSLSIVFVVACLEWQSSHFPVTYPLAGMITIYFPKWPAFCLGRHIRQSYITNHSPVGEGPIILNSVVTCSFVRSFIHPSVPDYFLSSLMLGRVGKENTANIYKSLVLLYRKLCLEKGSIICKFLSIHFNNKPPKSTSEKCLFGMLFSSTVICYCALLK